MEFLTDALRYIGIFFLVIMVFNLMIVVHEWGHFVAARWRGLKVEKFQIWFGNPIWKKTHNGVQYGLGWIPAGGFVALPQMAPMDAIEGGGENREELPPISPLDKIIVAFAGPLFSFLLACFFAVVVWQVGKPEQEGNVTRTIGYVFEDSPAFKAGLKPDDEIISIDGRPVKRFSGIVDSVQWLVISSESDPIPFVINRPSAGEMTIPVKAEKPEVEPTSWWKGLFRRPQLRNVGILGKETPMVAKVQPYSPAAEAGVQANDLIMSVDGHPLMSTYQLGEYIEKNPNKLLSVVLSRKGQKVPVTITPRLPDQRPSPEDWAPKALVGVVWDLEGQRKLAHPAPFVQIRDALKTMRETIGAIVSRKSEVSASHLSGPIGIFRVYYTLFESSYGWNLILWFSVVLNVNLAVMNMLPFPVLDGGHITMAIVEWIRRRPINLRVLEVVQTACVLLLLSFMAFVTMKDAGDWFGGPKKKDDVIQQIKFLPPAERTNAAPSTK